MNSKKFFVIVLFFLLLSTSFTSADVIEEIKEQIMELGCWLIKLLFYISSGIGALFILLAGVKYLTSDSVEERCEARNRIIFVIVGLSVVIIACPLVSYFIEGTKIAPLPKDCCPVYSPAYTFTGGETTTSSLVTPSISCAEKCQEDDYEVGKCVPFGGCQMLCGDLNYKKYQVDALLEECEEKNQVCCCCKEKASLFGD